jgi:hypothetical protein
MTSTSKIELQKLCRFVRIINKGVDSRLTSCYDLSVYIVNSVHIFISLYLYVLWLKRNKESNLIPRPTSWDDRNYSYSHQLYPSGYY